MTTDTIKLVQTSFEKVIPYADKVAMVFYEQLITMDPRLQPLLPNDPELMNHHRARLFEMFKEILSSLDNFDRILSILPDLGKRYAAYGVRPRDYEPLGEAWMETLYEILGEEFTIEHRIAWEEVYEFIMSTMITGAETS